MKEVSWLRPKFRFLAALIVAAMTLISISLQSIVPYYMLLFIFSMISNMRSGLATEVVAYRALAEFIVAMILYTVFAITFVLVANYLGNGFFG